MRRCSHLATGTSLPKRKRLRRHSNGSPLSNQTKPPKSVEAETPIAGLPFKVTTMVAVDSAPEPEPQEEPELAVELPSSLVPVPSNKTAEPAFGHRIGRPK